jgi:MFS family permease
MNLVLRFLGLVGLPVTVVDLTPSIAPTALGLMVFAIGEGLQAPRYYEYVADLAPKDQVGTYMGFAFLPVAIGTFFAGMVAGPLVEHYVEGYKKGVVAHPEGMWLVVGSIGILATILMLLYDRIFAPRRAAA